LPQRHTGQCHCGAIRIAFETSRPLAPRACQCSFCRKHGARSVSDPEGAATLAFSAGPTRYRFATRAADYLLCGRCGVYVGAMVEEAGIALVTLNLNAFDDPHPELEAVPVSYDGESAAERAASRRRRWTPVRIDRG
jgi:hypothetical protein